jgi:hypothetical protein
LIEILGIQEGREFEAAVLLRKRMLDLWPDLAYTKNDVIKIYVALKLYGHKIEDIDLLVIGAFREPRRFNVEFDFHPINSSATFPRNAYLQNFACVIEVKSHDPSGVKFEDKIAFVKYSRNGNEYWEPVTEKNRTQMFEVKKFLLEKGFHGIYIQDLIFFTGLLDSNLPKRPHNCIGADVTFGKILNIFGQISKPFLRNGEAYICFCQDNSIFKLFDEDTGFLKKIEPTSIDRRRMDRVINAVFPEDWVEELGKKQIIYRGRGGVGKTAILLQLAYKAFDKRQHRSLLLTYNKSLVADMRRTMALMGIPRNIESGGLSIETVHSFMGRIMNTLGVSEIGSDFLQNYETNKNILVDFLNTDTISLGDIQDLIKSNILNLGWDLIFIDEGQDWPSNEINIIKKIYGAHNLIIADGVDQFVRKSVADWTLGMSKDSYRVRRLTRCLRMKENLARFINDFSLSIGLDQWDVEPNSDARGGNVIIIEGDLCNSLEIHQRLFSSALELGNYPVDLLGCVPPSYVSRDNEKIFSFPSKTLNSWGFKVWDGVNPNTRNEYPTYRDDFRIVQYDSCRGLEGWIVINYAFDEFWEYKYRQALNDPYVANDMLVSKEEAAKKIVSLWSMIPLTRAMDTLVLNLSNEDSYIKSVLRDLYDKNQDFINWIKL